MVMSLMLLVVSGEGCMCSMLSKVNLLSCCGDDGGNF